MYVSDCVVIAFEQRWSLKSNAGEIMTIATAKGGERVNEHTKKVHCRDTTQTIHQTGEREKHH